MRVATETMRHRIENIMQDSLNEAPNAIAALYNDWIANRDDRVASKEIRDRLIPLLEENRNLKGVKRSFHLNNI